MTSLMFPAGSRTPSKPSPGSPSVMMPYAGKPQNGKPQPGNVTKASFGQAQPQQDPYASSTPYQSPPGMDMSSWGRQQAQPQAPSAWQSMQSNPYFSGPITTANLQPPQGGFQPQPGLTPAQTWNTVGAMIGQVNNAAAQQQVGTYLGQGAPPPGWGQTNMDPHAMWNQAQQMAWQGGQNPMMPTLGAPQYAAPFLQPQPDFGPGLAQPAVTGLRAPPEPDPLSTPPPGYPSRSPSMDGGHSVPERLRDAAGQVRADAQARYEQERGGSPAAGARGAWVNDDGSYDYSGQNAAWRREEMKKQRNWMAKPVQQRNRTYGSDANRRAYEMWGIR